MKLNNKGMYLYTILIFITMMFIAVDSNNIIIFILTKIVGMLLTLILLKLTRYVPSKYFD